ncbi:MAG: hypothetical protein QOK02_3224 [Mycobacterium sp.]|nr:hypothetical protein [Mycobacterium sp.]
MALAVRGGGESTAGSGELRHLDVQPKFDGSPLGLRPIHHDPVDAASGYPSSGTAATVMVTTVTILVAFNVILAAVNWGVGSKT